MLEKFPVGLKKHLAKVALALLFLSILTSVVAMAPVANAQGFPNVPTFPPRTATPTPPPSPTSTQSAPASPSPSPTEFPWPSSTNNPSWSPTGVSGGFWSPLTIGLVAVVALVAFTIPAAFFYSRRGKRKMLLDEDRPFNTQELPAASNRSAVSSRYQSSYQSQQTAKPAETSRYGQPPSYGYRQQQSGPSVTTSSPQSSSYSRPSPYTKICPHCKRGVRNDQNVCPYCDKRLR